MEKIVVILFVLLLASAGENVYQYVDRKISDQKNKQTVEMLSVAQKKLAKMQELSTDQSDLIATKDNVMRALGNLWATACGYAAVGDSRRGELCESAARKTDAILAKER